MNIFTVFQQLHSFFSDFSTKLQIFTNMLYDYNPLAWALLAAGIVTFAFTIDALGKLWRKAQRSINDNSASKNSHGSARFLDLDEIEESGLMHDGKTRMILGTCNGKFVGPHPSTPHALVIAPTGSGKTVGIAIPTALTYSGGLVLNDPKGELLSITSRYREENVGPIITLDPWGQGTKLCGRPSNRVNPMSYININSRDATTDAYELMRSICGAAFDGGPNAIFYQSAEGIIHFFILFVLVKHRNEPEKANLSAVYNYALATVEKTGELFREALDYNQYFGGLLAREAVIYLDEYLDPKTGKFDITYNNFRKNVKNYLRFLQDESLSDFFSKNDCELSTVQQEQSSVYIIVDPRKADLASVFLRVMYSIIMCEQMKRDNEEGTPLLIIFDELVKLGRFKLLEDMMTIVRSFNIRFLLILQNRSQLNKCYDNGANEIEGNCLSMYFSPTLPDDCKYISDRMGQKTIQVQSKDQKGHVTTSNAGRALMTPDEIARMPRKDILVYPWSDRTAKIQHLKYFNDARFRGKFDPKHHITQDLIEQEKKEEQERAAIA